MTTEQEVQWLRLMWQISGPFDWFPEVVKMNLLPEDAEILQSYLINGWDTVREDAIKMLATSARFFS